MGVSIALTGHSVCSPACMRYTGFPMNGISCNFIYQLFDFANCTYTFKLACVLFEHSQTRGIIPTVFKALESFQQNTYYVALGNAANYSTHIPVLNLP
jgi:hypothetical protein